MFVFIILMGPEANNKGTTVDILTENGKIKDVVKRTESDITLCVPPTGPESSCLNHKANSDDDK